MKTLEEKILSVFKGARQNEDMVARVKSAVKAVNEAAYPRYQEAHFSTKDGYTLGDYVLPGQDIKNHLHGCTDVFIGVCTLGVGVDRLLEKLQLTRLDQAYTVDIAASFAVEEMAEEAWRSLCERAKEKGLVCTTRYSCGYGDFDLSAQENILRLSGADLALSIKVNEGGMMYPTKSITFLCGWKEGSL